MIHWARLNVTKDFSKRLKMIVQEDAALEAAEEEYINIFRN